MEETSGSGLTLSRDVYPGWRDPEPNIAGVYDYWLGGKDNFRPDRELGSAVAQAAPWIRWGVRANRAFLCRAVGELAAEGIDQFIDIGSGLPTARNVHQVAQAMNPAAKVVYVDRDKVVLAHARALLSTDDQTIVVEGDARDPAGIVQDPRLCRHLDWRRPVAVLFVALLHFLTTEDDPGATVETFRDAMAPGSYLVISHVTPGDGEHRTGMDTALALYRGLTSSFTPRTPEQIAALFDGFDLMPPGVVGVGEWWADSKDCEWRLPMLAGVGHLPGHAASSHAGEDPAMTPAATAGRADSRSGVTLYPMIADPPGVVPVDRWRSPGHQGRDRADRRGQGAAGIGRLTSKAETPR